jgi:hypothetical protein
MLKHERVTSDGAAVSPGHADLRGQYHQCASGLGSRVPARTVADAPHFSTSLTAVTSSFCPMGRGLGRIQALM